MGAVVGAIIGFASLGSSIGMGVRSANAQDEAMSRQAAALAVDREAAHKTADIVYENLGGDLEDLERRYKDYSGSVDDFLGQTGMSSNAQLGAQLKADAMHAAMADREKIILNARMEATRLGHGPEKEEPWMALSPMNLAAERGGMFAITNAADFGLDPKPLGPGRPEFQDEARADASRWLDDLFDGMDGYSGDQSALDPDSWD
jgi:hypothetical protein